MDYGQKMVLIPQQSKIKIDDDDEEDVEALRLAALKSLRKKDSEKVVLSQVQKVLPQVTPTSRFPYKNPWPTKKNFYNRMQQKQNGNVYYHSHRNPNLISIVPVDEPVQLQVTYSIENTEQSIESCPQEISKFHRFKDSGSASEEEDAKEHKRDRTESITQEESEESTVKMDSQKESIENLQKNGNKQEEDGNDDDDDVLLMADLEEENSLERLMDEMEREMNDENKPSEKRKSNKDEAKDAGKTDETKNFDQKTKSDESSKKDRNNATTTLLLTAVKVDRRSISPHVTNRINQKRQRSLSPRSRPRKKSPRRSPIRQMKKSPRETRYRSPRRSPLLSRYSPRPRSPRPSPRRSPNRTSIKRSPFRRLSPRGRSPKLSSRSPRSHRSRSPRRSPPSKSPRLCSPKASRSRSPRLSRSRSPRYLSPLKSPRSKSPKLSPRRSLPPRRLRSRSRSPAASPRRGSPRLRSPKGSPRRTSPRLRSPRLSPRRSPWSSPRHSPHLSPRRRRSPKWSPKETKKHGPRSVSPDNHNEYAKDLSPIFKCTATPELLLRKAKQKDEAYERSITTDTTKESVEMINDPILEARRKKFESTRPIDPVNANKKIKLCKKRTANVEPAETTDIQLSSTKKVNRTVEEYNVQEADLLLEMNYEFEEFEETLENTSPSAISALVNTCTDIEEKTETEKSTKKKKKRDKELYQVGKLKSELPLSERIGKDKKSKKRKEITSEEDVDTTFEDIIDEEGDLRTELSRRRAERRNRAVPIQSARLLQSAFKGVVNEAVKNNAKANQRHVINVTDEKSNQKEIRRVTVLHRSLTKLHDSEDESNLDSKVPVHFRLGLNKQVQESRESKIARKASKRQGRKVKHKNHLSLKDPERIL